MDWLPFMLFSPLAPLGLKSIISEMFKLLSHFVPSKIPCDVISFPVLLPVLSKLVRTFSMATFHIWVFDMISSCVSVSDFFVSSAIDSLPNACFVARRAKLDPFLLNSLLSNFKAVLRSIELRNVSSYHI